MVCFLVFGVVLPPLLFTIGMPHVGPGLGTILTASELPVAVSMATLVLEEHVSIVRWMGVILILGGIAVGNVRVKAKLDSGQAQRDSSSQHS